MTLTRWLGRQGPIVFNLYAGSIAFFTYYCMYAFRKPFAVGVFEGEASVPFFPDIDFKILFILAQVVGYTISKFLGIKVVSEAGRHRRMTIMLGLVVASEIALFGFAVLPTNLKFIALFFNGLPLGMIWGLVFSYLEGRKSTEFLGAMLSASYIFASGSVKSVGRSVLSMGYSEFWMPFVTGLIYLPIFFLAVWLLDALPAPSKEDEDLRTRRKPMDRSERVAFTKAFAPGLFALVFFYMLLTAFRDFRDNFARELWDELGYRGESLVYTSSEVPVALIVMVTITLVMFIRSNRLALLAIHSLLFGGALLIGLSTVAWQFGWISPMTWMVLIGLGLYLGYVPFGTVLFDRIIAGTQFVGNVGFAIYLADSFGYLGSVVLMIYKNLIYDETSWLQFFTGFSYVTSVACFGGFLFSAAYFWRLGESEPVVARDLGNEKTVVFAGRKLP